MRTDNIRLKLPAITRIINRQKVKKKSRLKAALLLLQLKDSPQSPDFLLAATDPINSTKLVSTAILQQAREPRHIG